MSTRIRAGIDIGTRQIAAAIGEYDTDTGTVKALAGTAQPSRAIKNGCIISIPDAARDIRDILWSLENTAGVAAEDIVLGMRGEHFKAIRTTGSVAINRTDNVIMNEDIQAALDTARTMRIPQDRELFDEMALSFTLDHQRGVSNPLGLFAGFLSVDALLITAKSAAIGNACKALELAGLGNIQCVYSPLVLADAVLSREEKESGCVLIDIGTEMTSIISYYDEQIWDLLEIADGGDRISKALVEQLGVTYKSAEIIKQDFHKGMPSFSVKSRNSLNTSGGIGTISEEELAGHIGRVAKEYFEDIRNMLQNKDDRLFHAPCEVVLTGGGAKLPRITAEAEKTFGIPARVGLPRLATSSEDLLTDTSLTTALTLLTVKAEQEQSKLRSLPQIAEIKIIFQKLLRTINSI